MGVQPNKTADPDPAILAAFPKKQSFFYGTIGNNGQNGTGFPELQEFLFLRTVPADGCTTTNTSDCFSHH